MIGRLLLKLRQRQTIRKYESFLKNGADVYLQNCAADSGVLETTIQSLDFVGGGSFKIRDGLSAAHTFSEIFVEDHYPRRLLRGAHVVVDVGANIGLFSSYARRH